MQAVSGFLASRHPEVGLYLLLYCLVGVFPIFVSAETVRNILSATLSKTDWPRTVHGATSFLSISPTVQNNQVGAAQPLSLKLVEAALGVSLVPTVMQMRCIVWEPSDWFRWGTMVRKSEVIGNGRKSSEKFGSRKSTEMVGSRRRSSAVGSRRGIKEGHLSCYYTMVKSELIYVYEG